MKIRKFFIIVLFFSLGLFGCNQKRSIRNVEEILNKFEDTTSIDIGYGISVSSLETNFIVTGRIIVKEICGKLCAYMEMSGDVAPTKMYYIGDYVVTAENEQYEVYKSESFDFEAENPVPSFDFQELKYQLTSKKEDDSIIYTIEIDDSEVKRLLDEMTGNLYSGSSLSMTMEITVDNKTEELERIEISSKAGEFSSVQMTIYVKATGDDVSLEIPDSVYDAISEYILYYEIVPVDYRNTEDGVVKYWDIGSYNKIVYDKTTNKFVVLRTFWIDIYNDDMELEKQIFSVQKPIDIDADQGKLVVCYGTKRVKIYDLNTYEEYLTLNSEVVINEITMDDKIIIYAEGNSWSNIFFHNFETGEQIKTSDRYSDPLLTINRKDHLLYVVESDISSADLLYFNTQSGECEYLLEDIFGYVQERVYFNGKHILCQGKLFNRLNGNLSSNDYLSRKYPAYHNFVPEITLFESNRLTFVGSLANQNKIAIYDNKSRQFVYLFLMDHDSVFEVIDGKFLATSKEGKYVALIDLQSIDDNLIE
jgi:hypothetical protein